MITKEMVRSGLNQGIIRLMNETPDYEAVLRESLGPERKSSVRNALLFPEFVASDIRKEGFK